MFDEIMQVITNVGFPIACCFVLFKQQNKLTDTLSKLSETLSVINNRLDNIEDALKIREEG